MEAMARRVLRDQELPSISRLVDIGNIISLRHLVPAGGHAIDAVAGNLTLCRAEGDEIFVPFGSDKPESPEAGEVIFCEGKTVLTRRWTWRQANHTLVTPDTTALEFNVDGLPPVTLSVAETACRELITLIERFCGGECRHEFLTGENQRIRIDPPSGS
jgi:DNA/RNA-binding domain of Phe-tRNA-synthetase-like protein